MAGMVRPLNKACKIAFDVLGVPLTLQDDKGIKKFIKKETNKKYGTEFQDYPKIEYRP